MNFSWFCSDESFAAALIHESARCKRSRRSSFLVTRLLSCCPSWTMMETRWLGERFATRGQPVFECGERVLTVEVGGKHRDEGRETPWTGLRRDVDLSRPT